MVICRNPKTGKWLAVDESRDRGWWIPGGGVDAGETFRTAAKRECLEEAGVEIVLKGIIAMDHHMFDKQGVKMRVVFYAEPADPDCIPKQKADKESNGAEWLSLQEFAMKENIRGDELIIYGQYLEKGGQITPLSFMCEGHDGAAEMDSSKKVFTI